MTDPAAVHGNFTIKRRYPATPAKVFAACADPAIKKTWYAESDTHEIKAFESDFRVGGAERLTYLFGPNTLFPGVELTNEGVFHDIVDGRRIIISSRMGIAGRPISVALETMEVAEADGGTDLTCTFQGVFFEGSDGRALREQGWNDLLDRLGRLLVG